MTKTELAQKIYQVAYLRGEFKLRSGTTSNEYFDKYRFEAQPQLLAAIAEHLAPLVPVGTEALCGLEMGGIPIATALSLKTGMPAAFIRKKAKDYGTCQFAEGLDLRNKKVCIIEDVVTTGGQVLLSADDLKNIGAQVGPVLCVIQRAPETPLEFTNKGLSLSSLFKMQELKAHG